MTYQLKNLSVASLDFDDIKTSLISFLSKQPELADIDFANNASTANLLINLLSTVTAYNGVYAQFGYVNSFATTTTLYEIKFDCSAVFILISIVVYAPVSIKTLSQGIPNKEHIAYFIAAGVPLQLK